jgi:hypothetical protein
MMHPDRPDDSRGKPSGVLVDQLREVPEYTIDRVDDLSKATAHGINCGGTGNVTIKRYVKREVGFHFHLFVWNANRDRHLGDYCVKLKWPVEDSSGERSPSGAVPPDRTLIRKNFGRGEQLVFISRVKFLKKPESACLWIRSEVRLQLVDFCDRGPMPNALDSPITAEPLMLSQTNRERGVSIGEITTGEPPCDVVENGSSIMNTITNDECPASLRDWLKRIDPEQILRLTCVEFGVGYAGFIPQESVDFRLKGFQVFAPSIQLLPTFP